MRAHAAWAFERLGVVSTTRSDACAATRRPRTWHYPPARPGDASAPASTACDGRLWLVFLSFRIV